MRNAILELADAESSQPTRLNDKRGICHNPGLLLHRFLAETLPPSLEENDNRKRGSEDSAAVFGFAIDGLRSDGLQDVYSKGFARYYASFPEDGINISEELETEGRLIVGLGTENVLETGLRLNHIYGVPIIPGSALKGLAAHYCHQIWGQTHNDSAFDDNMRFRREGDLHPLLFGTTDDGGVIAFHDAWTTPPSLAVEALRLDVMTPHHPAWQTNEAPPTDFDSPVPVHFLSVVGTFQICLSWSGPREMHLEQASAWTNLAMTLLKEALSEWGIGGKTSSGYGRLVSTKKGAIETFNVTSASGAPSLGSEVSLAKELQHTVGQEVEVIKFLDEKGKAKFRSTKDGFIGHAGAEDVSDIDLGIPIKMWVKSRNMNPKGYTLTRIKPKLSKIAPTKGKQR